MSCELSGHSECPVVEITTKMNGYQLHLSTVGKKIENSYDPAELENLGEQAGQLQRVLDEMEVEKNGIHKCRTCPLV